MPRLNIHALFVVPHFHHGTATVRNAGDLTWDGKQVVYEVTSPDWEDNRYDTILLIQGWGYLLSGQIMPKKLV